VPNWIESVEELQRHYGAPAEASQVKVTPFLTPAYRTHIERSRFVS
jgi:hypothetical protein